MKAAEIKTIAVIGAGIMGEGIAQNFAQAGLDVRLVDQNQEILDKCLKQIEANLRQFVEFDLLREDVAVIKARIKAYMADNLAVALDDCGFIVEAIPELMPLKKDLLAKIDAINPQAIVGSNTSSFTISAIAEGSKYPGRVVGTHYFNPAHIMPLVEIHRGKETRDDVVAAAKELIERAGKITAMVLKEVPGFIVNRIQGAMEREIDYLLDEGIVTPQDLDKAATASYGFRLACIGPQEQEDVIGLDTALRVSGNLYKTLSNKTTSSPALAAKVEKGELGIKSMLGWYDYRQKNPEQVKRELNAKLLRQLRLFQTRQQNNH